MSKGIDVSSYQGFIDWKKVANDGVEFAILKVIRKNLSADTKFETNWSGAKAAGIPVQGVYNYSYATTVSKAQTDAKKVVNILAGRKTMVYLDVEDNCQKNLGRTLIEIINAYGKVIEDSGNEFAVYTGLAFYKSYIKPYKSEISYPFWIARYPSYVSMKLSASPSASKKPSISHKLLGWQYSSKGIVSGISGNVDLNEFYVSTGTVTSKDTSVSALEGYSRKDFIKDVQSCIGAKVDGVAGSETLSKTITVSKSKNNRHSVVKPIQKYLNSLGYSCGTVDGMAGSKFDAAVKAYQKANGCTVDGEITAKGKTWKKLLGLA